MARETSFPLPFPSLRTMTGVGSAPYIVGAIFTAGYAEKANLLALSCEKFALPYELHEVPAVHRSMSVRGSDDLRFTKANFIRHMLRTHQRPVVYIDADCEFVARPDLLTELVRARCDFAVYNWLADTYTDRFRPVGADGSDDPQKPYRYFRYAGSIEAHSTTQLIGAGQTQFYRNSVAARSLLARWFRTVREFPGCGDDDCLDLTFNNLGRRDWLSWVLRYRWLPKAYARCLHWIYAEPVINHPDIGSPSAAFPRIRCPRGRKRVYASRTQKCDVPLLFPRDCIIDTQEQLLCKLVDGELVAVGKTPCKFWV